jgi:hypothetical protein
MSNPFRFGTFNRYTLGNFLLRAKGWVQRKYRLDNFLVPIPPPRSKAGWQEIRQPVFVVGCGRSGTTMLFNVLAEHPSLVSTTGFPDGEDTQFWVEVAGAWMAGIGGVNSRTAIGHCQCLPMSASDLEPGRREYVHRELHRRYRSLRRPGQRLLNKNPHLSNKLGFLLNLFSDASFIHIIRHPYPTIASWKAVLADYPHLLAEIPDRPGACMNLFPNRGWRRAVPVARRHNPDLYDPNDRGSIRLLARHWKIVNATLQHDGRNVPGSRYFLVRYEDLLEQQNVTLERLLTFCGLPPKHTWKLQTRKPQREKWESELSPEELRLIDDEISNDADRFGYKLGSGNRDLNER